MISAGTGGAAESRTTKTLKLASWDDRFVAWLIDVILVSAVLSAFGQAAGAFSLLTGSLSLSAPFLGVNGLGLWLNWTVLEGRRGQSAGKMVVDIAVTDEYGEAIDYVTAATESFGKAFLLRRPGRVAGDGGGVRPSVQQALLDHRRGAAR